MRRPAALLERHRQPGTHERGLAAARGTHDRQEARGWRQGERHDPIGKAGRERLTAKEEVGVGLVKKQQAFVGCDAWDGRILLPGGLG